jgi:predicted ATPase
MECFRRAIDVALVWACVLRDLRREFLAVREHAGALIALSTTREQAAPSWELRAASSVARLLVAMDQRDEARRTLLPVYEWFTEGFDTADLEEAKALLDNLACSGWSR